MIYENYRKMLEDSFTKYQKVYFKDVKGPIRSEMMEILAVRYAIAEARRVTDSLGRDALHFRNGSRDAIEFDAARRRMAAAWFQMKRVTSGAHPEEKMKAAALKLMEVLTKPLQAELDVAEVMKDNKTIKRTTEEFIVIKDFLESHVKTDSITKKTKTNLKSRT